MERERRELEHQLAKSQRFAVWGNWQPVWSSGLRAKSPGRAPEGPQGFRLARRVALARPSSVLGCDVLGRDSHPGVPELAGTRTPRVPMPDLL